MTSSPPESAPVAEESVAEELAFVARAVDDLRRAVAAAESDWGSQIARVHPGNHDGALNLVHYWAIRQHDLRDLQPRLAAFGLSSLGRSESRVQASLDAVARAIGALAGRPENGPAAPVTSFTRGPRLLRRRACELLGPRPARRRTRIMVTLPSQAAADAALVHDLIAHGMGVARINCAHDGPAEWAAMIAHVRRASAATGQPCRIAMDLAGPKLRRAHCCRARGW
ncbi:pyruvate kinase [Nonomuraea turcica]|uniref:pyruvate kinase n=1 Tax=Nonomuraea sp. G32 TaxID=3067274 RepID=UPI00273C21F8|nr:pyruvate kinase [Nonomuraea sp. G32]MDP4510068.1 pyruvate kinase [Nonomuraea sp. G32]